MDKYAVAQDETSKKPSGQEKGKKKLRRNTNDEDLKFCMMHGKNPTHTTEQCRTLKREVDKQKKSRDKNGEKKSSKRGYNPSQEEIHALAAFARDALKRENSEVDEEIANFETMSVSGDEKDEK